MSDSTPIAIVGMSCLFPKADDLQAYWSNIKNGVDAITPIPERTHWKVEDFFDGDPKSPDRTYARRGGFISAVDFNPMDFGISPKDIEATDTTQLLGMVAARQALIDAGYGDGDGHKPFNRDRTSVILGVTGALELVIPLGARLGHPIWRRALKEAGVSNDVAEDVVQRISDSYVGWQENSFPGLLGNVAAGRIASRLDLGGTNCVVDAACASSMAALHLACLELESGRAEMVISGGVDTFNDIFMYMCFSKTPALSPSGDAKPFDRDCDGTILGEGLGMLVLKRLDDAQRDGDRIYAVIKGIGSSSDGRGNAIYAPRADGQTEALERAYAASKVSPKTIELIEAHGTGTKVGDATEIQALSKVFGNAGGDSTWAALGSVKSQIGHTKAAAGVAGLIKAALALNHKVLPPTIKVTQPVEEAAPDKSPFYVNTQKRPWLARSEHPRRAGVSSFGFGGTNFHCVLEEHHASKPKVNWDGDVEILALAEDRIDEMRKTVTNLKSELSWQEVRQLAQNSRRSFRIGAKFRLALPLAKSSDLNALRQGILTMFEKHPEKKSWVLPNGAAFGANEERGKLAFLFPGQGSQYVGMLRDLACQFPEMMDAFAEADRVFAAENADHSKNRLSDFIYPHPAFSDEARRTQDDALRATENAQPALGAVSFGALKVMNYFGVSPEATAGHSYGELPALCAASRLGSESLHLLSNVRGRLMASRNGHSDRGTMLAVQTTEAEVLEYVRAQKNGIVVANRNSPNQFVLAGTKTCIEQAAEVFGKRSVRTRVLPVSAAFHSSLVADAREPFAIALQNIDFAEASIPIYANTSAAAYPRSQSQTRELLASQMVKPVNFMGQIEQMFADGFTTFVEVGPGHVLSDLVNSILHGRDVETIALDSSKGSRSGTLDLAYSLCRLAARGHAVDLSRWEENVIVPERGAKASFTVPLSGANYRTPKAPRPAATKESEKVRKWESEKPTHSPAHFPTFPAQPTPNPSIPPKASSVSPSSSNMTSRNSTPPPENVTSALQLVQQGILSLQKLQEQTAQLHRQFLEGQESARRTLEALMNQRRQLLDPSFVPTEIFAKVPVASNADLRSAVSQTSGLQAPRRESSATKASGTIPPAPAVTSVAPALSKAEKSRSNGPLSSDVTRHVKEVVAEKTGYPAEMLELTMGLDSDLGIDSIKRVEIMAALRGRLPTAPEIKPEHLGTLQTLQEVVNFLSAVGTSSMPAPARDESNADLRSAVSQASGLHDSTSTSRSNFSTGVNLLRAAEVLLAVVAEKTGYPVEMLNLEMGMDSDLGVDSIKRVEIMAAVRTQLPEAPEIKPEHLGTLQTLQQVVDFLASKNAQTPDASNADLGRSGSDFAVSQTSGLQVAISPVTESRDSNQTAPPTIPLLRQTIKPVALQNPNARKSISIPQGALIWLADDGHEIADEVQVALKRLGFVVRRGATAQLIAESSAAQPAGLVILWPSNAATDVSLRDAFRLIQLAAPSLRKSHGFLVSVSRLDGAFGFGSLNGKSDPVSGGLAGLVKTARHEWPEVNCKAIDLDPENPCGVETTRQLIEELFLSGPAEVGIAQSTRVGLEVSLTPFQKNGAGRTLNAGDIVIVTGGARGITAGAVVQLAKEYQPKLVLLGRSRLTEQEPGWLSGLKSESEVKKAILSAEEDRSPRRVETRYREIVAQREIREHIRQIRDTGVTVEYRTLDVRDPVEVSATIAAIRSELGPIRGIVHGAGVLADKRIEDKTSEQFDLVYRTKVDGLRNLLAALGQGADELKLLALFSSYTGRFGRTGQVDYAAANEVLNKMAQVESRRRPNCRVVSFNWGPWNGGMVSDGLRKVFESEGVGLIEPEAGAQFFVREVSTPADHAVEVLVLAAPPGGGPESGKVRKWESEISTESAKKRTHAGVRGDSDSLSHRMGEGQGEGSSELAFEREVSVESMPCLASHVLNGRAVLPAALMIEWLAHGAVHHNPGLAFVGFENFRVFKGLKLEAGAHTNIRVAITRGNWTNGNLSVRTQLTGIRDGKKLIHAEAEILLSESLPTPSCDVVAGTLRSLSHLPTFRPAESLHGSNDLGVYGDGRLFHGHHFQGIEAVESCTEKSISARVKPSPAPKQWINNPLRPSWMSDPMALDCSFQMMILWSCEHRAAASLPCAVRSFRQFVNVFPSEGSRVVIRVTSAENRVATSDIFFLDRNGALLAQAEGFECVIDPALRDAFRLNRLKT